MMADKSNTHNVLVTFHSKCKRGDDDDVCSLCGNYPMMIMYKFIDYVLGKAEYLHGFDLFDSLWCC